MIKIFYDVETTGLDYQKHCIHSLAGFVEVKDVIVKEFDIKLRPHPKAAIDPYALRAGKVTLEELSGYPDQKLGFEAFKSILELYIDRYGPKDKAHLIGFNNTRFDDFFLRMFFDLNGSSYYSSYFHPASIDVMGVAVEYLGDRVKDMPSFKLHRVATTLGIDVVKDKLHGALYDVTLTREIYRIATGREVEL